MPGITISCKEEVILGNYICEHIDGALRVRNCLTSMAVSASPALYQSQCFCH